MNSAEEAADERVGAVVANKYRIHRLIGAGGMGSVYEAEHLAIGKRVALKFLHVGAREDETALLRFQQEARLISTVESGHIVQVFDWGEAEGHPFLVMELLDGKDLGERIEQLGRIPVGDAVRYAIEALRGLRKVHAAGIIHRDLKPENLFLVRGDDDRLHVKLVDFGLSKLVDPPELGTSGFERSARLTQAGAVVGTPLYMSPEQIEAVAELDQRTDLWSMGALLHEMLAGAPPFMDRSYARLVMAICQRDPPELTRINPEVSPALSETVRRALRRDRDQRFADADAFIAALEAAAVISIAPSTQVGAPADRTQPSTPEASLARTPTPSPAPISEPIGSEGGPLDATIAAHTKGAATVWLTDAPIFSIWRGEVDAPDRLRVEARDGSVRDLRLEPVGCLTLGRVKQVGAEVNDLVYPDVASRLAARLHHDGTRWWIERRDECSVPVQVGTRVLAQGERAPLVHGTFVTVGAMRATMVDRRYVSRTVPTGTVDPPSGLLARSGLEQEVATALQHAADFALVLLLVGGDDAAAVRAAVAVHRRWPSLVVARDREVVALLVRGDEAAAREHAAEAARVVTQRPGSVEATLGTTGSVEATPTTTGSVTPGTTGSVEATPTTSRSVEPTPTTSRSVESASTAVLAVGYWLLEGEAQAAGSEVELALDAIESAAGPGGGGGEVVALRAQRQTIRLSVPGEVLARAASPKQQILLFGIEEQAALRRIGPKVVGALEQELAAIVATQVGPTALVTRLAGGVIAACVPRKIDAASLGVNVQCEWHARAPVTDGKVELPRALSWEEVLPDRAQARAAELSRECGDAHGVLSALSGGLPYPIAGRVHAAIGAASAVERVKMLFDVLEGTWRFIAIVLAAAHFAKRGEDDAALRAFYDRVRTRAGLPLGAWRELARHAVKGFAGRDDPIGQLAAQVLDVKVGTNQTFDTLSNLLHSERNNFAHGHYNEARAAADVQAFEQITRSVLRALRPLGAWTLVTVQRTEPDLYGESQTVEFIDHTGPYASGARRRIGLMSDIRLANVVYLARWRDGLVLPLEPWMRRLASDDRFDLYWLDHLPRAGACNMSAVVSGQGLETTLDPRRLPPLLRSLASER